MSLLHSYSFGICKGKDEVPTEVLELFLDMVDNPDKKVEFASEIISAGMSGRINHNIRFNMEAYEATIRKNLMLGAASKRKREVFIDYSSEDIVETSKNGGMNMDYISCHTVDKVEDAYEQLILEDELRYAIDTIKSLQPVLLIEEKLDILCTIEQALKGIPESIKLLKNVCDKYCVVAEQIKAILGSGYTFEELMG